MCLAEVGAMPASMFDDGTSLAVAPLDVTEELARWTWQALSLVCPEKLGNWTFVDYVGHMAEREPFWRSRPWVQAVIA